MTLLVVSIAEGILVSLNVSDAFSQKTEIIFSSIISNMEIEPSRFQFKIPEGVDVIKRYHILKSGLQNEKNRFKKAVKKAKSELRLAP